MQAQSQGEYEKYILVKPPETANFPAHNPCGIHNVQNLCTSENKFSVVLAFLCGMWYTIILYMIGSEYQ